MGDFLGFGQAEIEQFFEEFSTSESPFIACTHQETAGKQHRRFYHSQWCDWIVNFASSISQRFIERLDGKGFESTQFPAPDK